MPFEDVLAVAGFQIFLGLVFLALLWPNERSATGLLRRWGVREPTAAEKAQALTYLRQRRIWYPWLLLGLPTAVAATGLMSANQNSAWSFPAVLLIGALLAEAFAQRRAVVPVRVAVPVRRGLADLVPRWALALHAVAALGALVLLGGAVAGAGWALRWYSTWPPRTLWLALAAAVLTVLLVWAVVALALRRPPVVELRIDHLLRARSARVPVGLGTAALCALLSGGNATPVGIGVLLAGATFWSFIANPTRTPVPA